MKRLLCFIIISISLGYGQVELNPKILKLNEEIESVVLKSMLFDFDTTYGVINQLIDKCSKLDYLVGEAELINTKFIQALALGHEDSVYTWIHSYDQKKTESIAYGIKEAEIKYKLLKTLLEFLMEGFEFKRESLLSLAEIFRRNDDYSTQAYILYFVYDNSPDDKNKYANELDKIFEENEYLKSSYQYIAYKNLRGVSYFIDKKYKLALECFTDTEKYSKELNLKKLNKVSRYNIELLSAIRDLDEKGPQFDKPLQILVTVKDWYPFYASEIMGIADAYFEDEQNDLAELLYKEYVENRNTFFSKNKVYYQNLNNTQLFQNFSTYNDIEQFKASELSEAYYNLAWLSIYKDDYEIAFKNFDIALDYYKTLDYNGWVVKIYRDLAALQALGGAYEKSDKSIKNALKYLNRVTNKDCPEQDCKVFWSLEIADYFLDYTDLKNKPAQFGNMIRLLNEALEESRSVGNHQYEYVCLLKLGATYGSAEKENDKQYRYFIQADSMLVHHDLTKDRSYNWRFIKILVDDKKNYQKAREIIKDDFEYYFSHKEYVKAYKWGWSRLFNSLYKLKLNDKDYAALNEMLTRFDDIEKDHLWSIKLKLEKWKLEVTKNESKVEYNKSLKLIPQLMGLGKDMFELNDEDLNISYLWLGKILLKHASLANEKEIFTEFFSFIEPIQWEDSSIHSDNWFLDFINGTYGPFNDTLYTKYIDRILSYPLSAERLLQKGIHGDVLINVYGNITESIRIYEEALLEAKQLGLIEEELVILKELAYRYAHNRQFSLSKRRYFEARELAKALGNDEQLEIILPSMLDQVITVDDPKFYELCLEYSALGKKTGNFLTQIQAIGLLLQYFQHIQEPDSAVQYMMVGFSLKDSVITHVSILRYLSFVSDCFNYIDSDVTDKIVDPIKGWVFDDKKIEDPKLQRIYEEMIYLKDFDFSTLDQENINEYPFVYNNALDNSITLRKYWGRDYLQTNEFKNKVEFLLSLGKKNKEFGFLNAFWDINGRIKDLEDVPYGGIDKFFGFGFNYETNTANNGLEVRSTFLKSPAYAKLNLGDVILIDSDEELSREYARDFMVSKINEADVLLNKPATFTVLRDGIDTILIDILPGDVQPNYYSEYPVKERQYLINKFFEISDNLLQTAENIRSYPGFTNTYREFLTAYPFRYKMTHNDLEMNSEQYIELLDRYETISTYNLVNESIKHKTNMQNNPVLIDEYRKYSARINQIQLELQKPGLNENELSGLQKARNLAYGELAYFENYNLEKSSSGTSINKFSFSDNLDLFNEFNVIVRYCITDYLKNASFMWIKSQNRMEYYYTSAEEKIKTKVKIANQLLSYSVGDTTRGDDLENSIIDLFSEIISSEPILPDEYKNKELNVLIIPEGSMNFFPMELMPIRFESDTTKYFYYGEFANITYAPSLSSFVEFSKKKGKDKSKKKALLVSANPESESTANYIDNLFVMRSDYGNIENVDNEINSINATMSKRKLLKKGISTTVFDSKDISETQFKATDLGEYKYIHIAAHGVHDDENPNYSGILLGRRHNDEEDGILQAHEIFPLNLNADLVTLSSCFSGFGEIDPNEGNLGIYRTFLIAGAKSVIISLWNVEDKSTALLFSKFYEYLKEGHSKAKSLRLAKMYLKNETRFSHPFYWAPFILMGEA